MSRNYKARLGFAGYVALLAAFRDEPADIRSMRSRTGIGRDTLYHLIPDFHARGMLHISSWLCQPGIKATPIYSFGPGEDAAPPKGRTNIAPLVRERVSPEVISFSLALAEMSEPANICEIRAETGIHRDTIRKMLDALREHNMARIVLWTPRACGGGQHVASYQLGAGTDARYPSAVKRRLASRTKWRRAVAARAADRAIHAAIVLGSGDERLAA